MKLNILIVDDGPRALRLGRAIIEREGHAVVPISNWSQVAPAMFGEKVDMLLVDVNMPGLNGDRLVEIVKQTGTGRRTPIILVSNLPEEDLRQKAQLSGADGWAQKPLTTEKVRELVKRHLPQASA